MIMTQAIRNSSLEYIDFLHNDAVSDTNFKRTYVFLGVRKSGNKAIHPVPIRVEEILNGNYLNTYEFNHNCDYYISSNVFRRHSEKSRAMLFSLENIIIDVDNHTSYTDDMKVQYLISRVLEKVTFKPTGINNTGRGVQFVYHIDKVSFKLEWLIRAITECLIKEIEKIISEDANLKNFAVDNSASKNTAGFFRLAGTVNTKVGKVATFRKCGRKYNHQEFVNFYNKDIFGKISKSVSKRKNKSVSISKSKNTNNHSINSSNLFNTRLNWINERINTCQSNGNIDGFRDNCLFLAGNCFYFQNTNTFRGRLEQLNNSLMCPMDINQVRSIEDYIEKAHGYRYTNEKFLTTLGYTHEEATKMYQSSNKRLQGQEHTKQIKERNERIIADFLAEIDVNPKDLTSRLAIKYELSESQINRVVKDVRKQHRLEKAQRVAKLRESGILLHEIAPQEARSVSTIHRLEKLSKSLDNNSSYDKFQKTHNSPVCLVEGLGSLSRVGKFDDSFVSSSCSLVSSHEVLTQEVHSFGMVGDDFKYSKDDVSFDSNYINLFDGFVSKFNTGNYPYLSRFLNDDDMLVLKVFYSYFANQRLVNGRVDNSNSVYMSLSRLHYLCLSNSSHLYGSKFDSISSVKRAIFDKYHIKGFSAPYESFVPYFNRYVSDLGEYYNRLRVSLRKMIYLGLIFINDDVNSRRYHCMSLSPTSLDIDSADSLACKWYVMGYSLKYICYNSYVDLRDIDNSIKLVSSSKVMNFDISEINVINDLVADSHYFPLSRLSRKQRDIVEVCTNEIGNGFYCVVKIKDKSMLENLGISDVRVGSKILLLVND